MGDKNEIIRRALNHYGIVVTTNIPEHITEELRVNGYKIRKSKKWKKWKNLPTDHNTPITNLNADVKSAQTE